VGNRKPGICGDELAEFAQKLGDEFVDMAKRQFSDAMIMGEVVEEPPGGTIVPESIIN